jgi:hypothetical protein
MGPIEPRMSIQSSSQLVPFHLSPSFTIFHRFSPGSFMPPMYPWDRAQDELIWVVSVVSWHSAWPTLAICNCQCHPVAVPLDSFLKGSTMININHQATATQPLPYWPGSNRRRVQRIFTVSLNMKMRACGNQGGCSCWSPLGFAYKWAALSSYKFANISIGASLKSSWYFENSRQELTRCSHDTKQFQYVYIMCNNMCKCVVAL